MNQNVKSSTTAGLLGIFLGSFGAHNWYLGEKKKGIIHVCLMCSGLLVDLVAAVIIPMVMSPLALFNAAGLLLVLTSLASIAMAASAIWGLVEGVILITQGDAGLAQKGYPVATPMGPQNYGPQQMNGYNGQPMNNMNGMNGANGMYGMNGGMNNMNGINNGMNGNMGNMDNMSGMNGNMGNMNGMNVNMNGNMNMSNMNSMNGMNGNMGSMDNMNGMNGNMGNMNGMDSNMNGMNRNMENVNGDFDGSDGNKDGETNDDGSSKKGGDTN